MSPTPVGEPIWNHYHCDTCQQVTITKHEDPGVTPMFLRCRATPGCEGTGQSAMYRGPQGDLQVPHLIWYRPPPSRVARVVKGYPFSRRRSIRAHYEAGGCLEKPGPATALAPPSSAPPSSAPSTPPLSSPASSGPGPGHVDVRLTYTRVPQIVVVTVPIQVTDDRDVVRTESVVVTIQFLPTLDDAPEEPNPTVSVISETDDVPVEDVHVDVTWAEDEDVHP